MFKKSVLAILFGMSLIVSHYGTSYLFVFSLVFVIITQYILSLESTNKLLKRLCSRFKSSSISWHPSTKNNRSIPRTFVLFMLVFMVAWFYYVSNSAILISITNLGSHISSTIFSEFMSIDSSRGLEFLTRERSTIFDQLQKGYYLLTQALIAIGFVKVLIDWKTYKFNNTYLLTSLFWLLILFCAIAVSGFAMMNPLRLLHLSLFVLSPFAVLGGITLLKSVQARLKITSRNSNQTVVYALMYVLFIGFFLVSVGFINTVADGPYKSISLSQASLNKDIPIEERSKYYYNFMPEHDVFSAKWLSTSVESRDKIPVYGTLGHGEGRAALISYGMFSETRIHMLPDNLKSLPNDAYIYLLYVNVMEGIGLGLDQNIGQPIAFDFSRVTPQLEQFSRIYTNKGSEILFT
ncbi:MAG: DUF2206 domain-containing protein [Sphaerochaetaceae bacterium]|nr:DUF2206 domain-containing protein [Sphaerochaetaceae bacterium]